MVVMMMVLMVVMVLVSLGGRGQGSTWGLQVGKYLPISPWCGSTVLCPGAKSFTVSPLWCMLARVVPWSRVLAMYPEVLPLSSVPVFPHREDLCFQWMRDRQASGRLSGVAVLSDHHRVVLKSRVSILSGLLRGRLCKKKKKKGIKTTLILKKMQSYRKTTEKFLYLHCQTWSWSFQRQRDPGSGFCALCFHPHNKAFFQVFPAPETHSAPSPLQFSMREDRYHHSNDRDETLSKIPMLRDVLTQRDPLSSMFVHQIISMFPWARIKMNSCPFARSSLGQLTESQPALSSGLWCHHQAALQMPLEPHKWSVSDCTCPAEHTCTHKHIHTYT